MEVADGDIAVVVGVELLECLREFVVQEGLVNLPKTFFQRNAQNRFVRMLL